jgi:hypothetical protein
MAMDSAMGVQLGFMGVQLGGKVIWAGRGLELRCGKEKTTAAPRTLAGEHQVNGDVGIIAPGH